jgi:uncharacterized protein YegL
VKLIILSLILGFVSWIAGLIIYAAFYDTLPLMGLIGVIFAILAAVVMIGVHLISVFCNAYDDPLIPIPDFPGVAFVIIIVGIVVTLLLGSVFQWIYGLNAQEITTEPTSYIFVIDDSGSTDETDPNMMRYSAINAVLEDKDESFPYMVYSFGSDTTVIRPMGAISEGTQLSDNRCSGGTAIRGALNQVMEDYESGQWEGGAYPKVILLTDGYAQDCHLRFLLNRTLKKYNKANISISTVGLEQVDEDLMQTIADTTNGVYINVSDASMLNTAMAAATKTITVARDLLSVRPPVKNGALFAILRIVFVAVLGMLLGGLVCVCYGNEDSIELILISSGIKAIIGALVMELGTNVFGMSAKFAWLILWLLLALTIAMKPTYSNVQHSGVMMR